MIFEAIQLRHSTHTHHSLQLQTQHLQQQQQLQHHQLQHRFLEDQDLDQQQQQHQHRLDGDGNREPALKTLDFSLTKRLLAAVFFLLVIYAWKQYIEDEEESDTIYF